jgi:hypothetical protein
MIDSKNPISQNERWGLILQQAISKIADTAQEQGKSRRKSAVRRTFWRMSIYFKEAFNPPQADY